MEEIEYGEFLRLDGGKIVRYGEKQDIRVENNRYIDYSGEYEWETRIANHSSNIIDLIEVGDIVRIEFPPDEYCNEPVEVIWTIKGSAMLNNLKCGIKSKEVKLKAIVTKEQFENVEYKLDN